MTRRARGALAALTATLAALLPAPARPQPYDPAHRWRTIDTPHFQVHFHQGEEALAAEAARAAERAHEALAPLFGHAPRARTQVVLSDDVDLANGSATPLPRNTIRLHAAPPESLSELHDHGSWLDVLVLHEYAHVLHLDQVGGVPAGANAIFGRIFFPNGLLPAWAIEGLAVAHEADVPGAGRNASALFEMYERALALSPGGLPPIDEISNPWIEWPRGSVPYLLGGRFVAWLRDRYGAAAVRGFLRDQGARIWPWAPSRSARPWFGGQDLGTLWAAYAAEAAARHRATVERVRAEVVTPAVRLTRLGARVESPRYTPDGGALVFFHAGLDRRPGIFRIPAEGGTPRRLANVELNGALDVGPGGDAVVAETEVRREYLLRDDLWRHDLARGTRTRLTRGERATDPDLAPDGRSVVYVRRSGPGRHALVRRDLGTGAAEVLLDRPGVQLYQPRHAPDGARLVLEVHEGGRRDVAVLEAGEVRRLTADAALDTSPSFTPDGRHVVFSSDRDGIFDVWLVPVEGGEPARLTRVETGAFQPQVSPDGNHLAFVSYSKDGYDLSVMPFAVPGAPPPRGEVVRTASFTEGHPLPAEPELLHPLPAERGEGGVRGGDPATAGAHPAPVAPPALPDSRPYRALPTALPTSWFPVWLAGPGGDLVGATTFGVDVLSRHFWTAAAWWTLDVDEPGYTLSYQGGWSWPRVDLSSSRQIVDSPGEPDRLLAAWMIADAGATFTFTRLARQLSLRLGWSGTRYDGVEPAPSDAGVPEPLRFEDGFLSDVSLTATYGDARRFARSISAEEGRTISLRLRAAAPETGSDHELYRARAALAQYLRVRGTRHAVLALRAAGAVARGTLGGQEPYTLGGGATVGVFSSLLGIGQEDVLRGYRAGAFDGNALVLATAELRLPLATPRLGRGTWPLFLRRIHGAAFADAGQAFELHDEPAFARPRFRWGRLAFSAGAELRLETVLGYYLPVDLRLGVARGLGRLLAAGAPRTGEEETQVYLVAGQSF